MSTEKKEKKENKKNVHAGHRKRMKKEFLARGLDGWPDHRVLEFLLFYTIPRGDVNPLAHALVDRFGSVANVLDADYEQLLSVQGVGENTAAFIRFSAALYKRYGQQRVDVGDVYEDTWQFKELLEPEFTGARNELVFVVRLDAKWKLISVKQLGEGDVTSASLSPRRVMEAALSVNAAIVVLAHNHPGGLAVPSKEDIIITQHLARSLSHVGITLHDHLVFSGGEAVSMRESGYL